MTLAILLAAGAGRRMGGGKALLELAGEPALARCLRALRAGGCDELRVVLGPDAEAARRACPEPAPDVVVNPHPETGQTGSLKRALARGTGRGELFVLHTVDHPLVAAADVLALLDAAARRPAGMRIVLPVVGGRRGHPAVFEAGLAAEFLALGDDEPAHRVPRREPARVLEVPRHNPWLVRDLDTPADLAEARAWLDAGRGD
ncbi:MAG TPA: NTP transferase domain-containing protein [Planctomycetota bacterium]|nr:NTP transferase domain-containing protein [Planctomycetota bacterium]